MVKFPCWLSIRKSMLMMGITSTTISSVVYSLLYSVPTVALTVPVSSSSSVAAKLSDVDRNYWANAFIQPLAEKNIITGFPDGTFRPNEAVNRAEFAAMVQKAFDNSPIRRLRQGGFADVPSDFWANSAIQDAYQMGFMSGYPGNIFLPNQQIPKIEAIVALSNGMGLKVQENPIGVVNTYYTDAAAIPQYALNDVAAATQANVVVNYPRVNQLNPLNPLTRGEASALLYQALVKQGKMQRLDNDVAANNYIVSRGEQISSSQDIVSVAAASELFTSLTSLLRTAGLAGILEQPGQFTVFAPTDEAFAALPVGVLQELQQPENRELLIQILRYHVVPGKFAANRLTSGELTTFEDVPLNVEVNRATNQIAVNDANVIQSNIPASNGVIHVINRVLIPPNLGVVQKPMQPAPEAMKEPASDVTIGRSTRGGSSYIGIAGNIGVGGNSTLSESNYAVMSKLGITNTLSVRPSVVFGGDTLVLIPLSIDFSPQSLSPFRGREFSVSPYLGAGLAIETRGGADFGLLVTGGIDMPLGDRFTANASINAAFLERTDVGLLLGIGYTF